MDDKDFLPAVPDAKSDDFEDKAASDTVQEEEVKEDLDEYYSLPVGSSRSIIWSLASLAFAVLSVGLCFLYYLGFAFAVFAAVSAVIFRRQFGYFNKPAVTGLIIAIFGGVFSAFSLIAGILFG